MRRLRVVALALLTLCPSFLFSLKISPWFGNFLEFHIKPRYVLQHYSNVESGINPEGYSSTDNFLGGEFYVRFLPRWEVLLESEWNTSRKHNMRFLSTALQGRYMLLDDFEGDPLSITLMADARYVPSHALQDVSTPYHAEGNLEAGISAGKNFDPGTVWTHSCYVAGLLGQANRGLPWIHGVLNYQATYKRQQFFGGYIDGLFGLGKNHFVNVDDFNGYANVNHQSIDLGVFYKYCFRIWGVLEVQYAHRVFARRYPEHTNMLYLSYTLPFSLL